MAGTTGAVVLPSLIASLEAQLVELKSENAAQKEQIVQLGEADVIIKVDQHDDKAVLMLRSFRIFIQVRCCLSLTFLPQCRSGVIMQIPCWQRKTRSSSS